MTDTLDPAAAAQQLLGEALAQLALTCIRTEYPHCAISGCSGGLGSTPQDPPPRQAHPAFYGCYDWHSAVHSHWLLARLLRTSLTPQAAGPRVLTETAAHIVSALTQSFRPELLDLEHRYLLARPDFEAPYGWAWLLQLASEVRALGHSAHAALWSRALTPLEQLCGERLLGWQERLQAPVTSGQHGQSAFALGLLLDWARGRRALQPEPFARATQVALRLHSTAEPPDLCSEPYGNDFLSPGLAHLDVLGRVLSPAAFRAAAEPWRDQALRLEPVVCPDPRDGKLAHLVGLNLSRAWMLREWAGRLTADAAAPLRAVAAQHRQLGLSQCGLDDAGLNSASPPTLPYALSHWIGSFVLYGAGR